MMLCVVHAYDVDIYYQIIYYHMYNVVLLVYVYNIIDILLAYKILLYNIDVTY